MPSPPVTTKTSEKGKKMLRLVSHSLIGIIWVFISLESGFCYPIDGFSVSGIRRLERLRLIMEKKLQGPNPAPGAQKPFASIKLNLLDDRQKDSVDFFKPDIALQRDIEALFPERHESYSLALLDITGGIDQTRFAELQGDRQFSPGSVGKLAIAAGLFYELGKIYPLDPEKRRDLLMKRMVVAGKWIHTDHHDVPIYNPVDGSFVSRPIREGDSFSLYEWADHMLSASANAAGSTVWKEVMLMREFGGKYPPSPEEEKIFFEKTPKSVLREMAMSVVNDPLRELVISQQEWQLGSFFTSEGQRMVPPGGSSIANPRGLLKFLIAMERGKILDEWSSLEIKRLMYMTAKRIRYASSPALNGAAVYFKSGSLYRCKPEPDFKCVKYQGNVENYMNSVAVVEHPDGRTYLIALMSNVLRKNSAVEHQSIATYIDRILSASIHK